MNVYLTPRKLLAVVALLGVTVLVGCGKSKPAWETAYPAEGTVKFNGVPLDGAQVTLVPEDSDVPDTVRPRGFTDAMGTFQLSTYADGDGAPEGKYKVVAMRFPVVGPKDNPCQGPNDLPLKYSKPETTDLKVEISAPETELKPLELTP